MNGYQELTECISANELLQALTTLQQMTIQNNTQLQLSFSQSSHTLFNTSNICMSQPGQNNKSNNFNESQMNFQLYIELKNRNKNEKEKKNKNMNKKSIHKHENNQNVLRNLNNSTKNITKTIKGNKMQEEGIKQKNINAKELNKVMQSAFVKKQLNKVPRASYCRHTQSDIYYEQLQQAKSRSHSPLNISSHKQRSLSKKYQRKQQVQKPNIDENKNCKKRRDNKQNIQNQIQEEAVHSVLISQNSKKIIMDLQKKGKSYVPIQKRINQMMKQKQEKIAKIQRANLTQKQIQQKECTFKPSINDYKSSNSKIWVKSAMKTQGHQTQNLNESTSQSKCRQGGRSALDQHKKEAKANGILKADIQNANQKMSLNNKKQKFGSNIQKSRQYSIVLNLIK